MGNRAEIGAGVEDVDLAGCTILVTGSTDGIGREAALAFGRLGATVHIHGRDRSKGTMVIESLRDVGSSGSQLFVADFESFEAVRQLAESVSESCDSLDILVNNAGGFFRTPRLTREGIEYTFAVNHLSPFLLTNLLLPLLETASEPQIVTVSSAAHQGARIDFDRIQTIDGYSGMAAYSQSKLANIMFTYSLARRLDGVTANCLHPGFVPGSSFFNRDISLGLRMLAWLLSGVPNVVASPLRNTVVEGAETIVYLGASSEVSDVSGEYFVDCDSKRSSSASYDEKTQQELWEASVELTGLDSEDVPSIDQ